MIEIRQAVEIRATAETVFAAIVDLRGYGRWLSSSSAYPGTTEISEGPVAAGTTYVESGPSGVRRGTVVEFEPPVRVAFRQPMTMKPRILGVIDIDVRYALTGAVASVRVDRVATLRTHGPLTALRPVVVRQFRREGERTLRALRVFIESGG